AAPLEHSTDVLGWRIEAPARRHFVPAALRARGVRGPAVAALRDDGQTVVDGETVQLDEVSRMGDSQAVAFVFDTRWCDGALELARDADLLVCESTFLDADAGRAREYGHLTARQAGQLAATAGARRLVLTHFSGRYPDAHAFLEEAEEA